MNKPLILVTLGSNGYSFKRLLQMLAKQPLYKDDRVRWFIQHGSTPMESLPADGEVVESVSRKRMEDMVKQSDFVVSHCGIGSINMMLSYQKRVIFVPRVQAHAEFSDDHQLQIAVEIKNPRMKVVMPDEDMPEITMSELMDKRLEKPMDITNYAFAAHIKDCLLGNRGTG